jgi:hypothetical protein
MRVSRGFAISAAVFVLLFDGVFVYRWWFYGAPVQLGGGGTQFLEPIRTTILDWTVFAIIVAVHVILGFLLFRNPGTRGNPGPPRTDGT